MKLTKENKEYINSLTYEDLLYQWRFAASGDPWFQDETGIYWGNRMCELRKQPGGEELHIAASKRIGWEK